MTMVNTVRGEDVRRRNGMSTEHMRNDKGDYSEGWRCEDPRVQVSLRSLI